MSPTRRKHVKAVKAAIQRFGRIDVLLNNAGFGLLGAVEEATARDVERLYGTDVFDLLKVSRAALPYMRNQRSGHVMNLSSVGGYRSGPGFGVYCSTKFAVEGLSEAMAAELSPLGIKVTIIEPGYFRTDFLEDAPCAWRLVATLFEAIEAKSAFVAQEPEKWRSVSLSTDFEHAATRAAKG
jgi:NAD(P)-dependent dehydrogenase (short-subunit alcohol dehydrogenase family)